MAAGSTSQPWAMAVVHIPIAASNKPGMTRVMRPTRSEYRLMTSSSARAASELRGEGRAWVAETAPACMDREQPEVGAKRNAQ
jgi:hypothetical protein